MKSFTKLFNFAASFTLLATAALMVSGCGGGGSDSDDDMSIMSAKAFATGTHQYEIKGVLITFDIQPIAGNGHYDEDSNTVKDATVNFVAGGQEFDMGCDYEVFVDPATGAFTKAKLVMTFGDYNDEDNDNLKLILGIPQDQAEGIWAPLAFSIEFRPGNSMTQTVKYEEVNEVARDIIINNRQQIVRRID